MKRNILALLMLACCAPLLAAADHAAQTRVKKAAEYRETKEAAEQQSAPTPETDTKRANTPQEQQPPNQGKSLENLLEGLLKPGEPR